MIFTIRSTSKDRVPSVKALPPMVSAFAPELNVVLGKVKLVSLLFGEVEPAVLNTSESPLASGPEPDE